MLLVFLIGSIPLPGMCQDDKAAMQAIKSGDIGLMKLYLEKNPDPELIIGDHSLIFWAIKHKQDRIVRLLIEYGAAVNKPDIKLGTPLMYAAKLDNYEICKILIDRGADPLLTNPKNKRASDFAIYYSESPTYNYLLSMEKQCEKQASVPSMQDGPYIYRETDDRVVINYFERVRDINLTRIIEKTINTGKADTIVEGIGWDKNSYHIKHAYAPNPFDVKTTADIFVIGDIHGKYQALISLLINNKIIDPGLKWIFGEGQLVLLGDVFDRGGSVTEVLWFLYELAFQARDSGGDVHLLLGNHEIMALTGDHRYLNYKYNYFTLYTRIDYYQLFEKNTVLGSWLRSQNVIVRINGYLFVHAGISPEFAAYNYSFSDINSKVQNYLNSGQRDEDGSPEDIILGSIGPLWYRGYYNINTNANANTNYIDDGSVVIPEVTQEFVDNYLHSKGLKRMILGHNEQVTINTTFKGKIISADVALDESGKFAQGLLISGDELFRCFSDGMRERIE